MADEFWSTDDEWAAIEPLIPMNRPGVKLLRAQRRTVGDTRPAEALPEPLPPATVLPGDPASDSDRFRAFATARGTTPLIRPDPTRKNLPPVDEAGFKRRNVIERAFSHLEEWRRVATRHDELARNFRATVILAAIFIRWT